MKSDIPSRILACLSIVVQCVTLAYFSSAYLYAAAIGLAALVGVGGWIRVEPRPWVGRGLVYVLAVGFAVRAAVPDFWGSLPVGGVYFAYAYGYAGAQFMLALQVLQLFRRFPDGRLPVYVPMLGIAVMVLAAKQFISSPEEHLIYRALTMAYAFLLAFSFALGAPRDWGGQGGKKWTRGRVFLTGLAAFSAIGLAWAVGSGLTLAEDYIVRNLGNILPANWVKSSPGFSKHARLGSLANWKDRRGDVLILRVFSEKMPGYLRGRAYTVYSDREWLDESERVELLPARDGLNKLPRPGINENLFDIPSANILGEGIPKSETAAAPPSDRWRILDVRATREVQNTVFTALGMDLVGARAERLEVDEHGMVELPDVAWARKYRIFLPTGGGPGVPLGGGELLEKDRGVFLTVPEEVDPEIRALAEKIFEGHETASEKKRAVERYFWTNYQYKLGIRVPPDREPLEYFLKDKPAAHCEYFASGAAVLLRLAGVPCRYVTGFVASERNAVGGYWIARNRNAHAWVEAYDARRGRWEVVEATPADGVPSEADDSNKSALSQAWDAVKFFLVRMKEAVFGGGLQWLGRLCLEMLGAAGLWAGRWWWLWMPLLIVMGGVVYYKRRRKGRGRKRGDSVMDAMRRLLTEADGGAGAMGWSRGEAETLHEFAGRIAKGREEKAKGKLRRIVEWYVHYAEVRYSGRLSAEGVETLKKELDETREGQNEG